MANKKPGAGQNMQEAMTAIQQASQAIQDAKSNPNPLELTQAQSFVQLAEDQLKQQMQKEAKQATQSDIQEYQEILIQLNDAKQSLQDLQQNF